MRPIITEGFRQSMGWLHTWLGIALSAILFAVFWTGTLTVFDKEIDQWMKPELRFPAVGSVALDDVVLSRLQHLDIQPGSAVWVGTPRDRQPAIRLYYDDAAGKSHEELLDPFSGEVLEPTDSDAGSDFFFRFHFMLHLPGVWGYYLVGLAAIGMLVLIVSGVFIHRKIFQEFFTFRSKTQSRRKALDLHNLTAVVALPFHFLIAFSGMLILATVYYPWALGVPYNGDLERYQSEQLAYEEPRIDPAGVPGLPPGSIDQYLERADAVWRADEGDRTSSADWLAIFNYNDANSYVVVERYYADRRIAIGPDQIVFNSRSGAIIDRYAPMPVHAANNWIEGLHWIQFDHWPLRWLYFLGGLAGCAMIGSGLIYWIEARVRKGRYDPANIRVVRAMTIGSTTGIIIASCAFLIANRFLPKAITFTETPRHELEIWAFFGVWLASFVHATIRGKSAWRDQCVAIAIGSATAALLNWFTTGDHPLAAARDSLWPVAIMDLLLLAGAACAIIAARRLRHAQEPKPRAPESSDEPIASAKSGERVQ